MSWQDELRKVKYVGRTGEKYLIPFITDLLKQQNMELTIEQLEMLSECIYSTMNKIGNVGYPSETLNKVVKKELDKLQKLNHIICNELERIGK